ncbi:MAG: calcium/sodium antiporter [Fibrobacter sp.]|nr:calcium/sodium antiporter [Fibrobacter sp.]
MVLSIVALVIGLLLLVWSADRFVEGSAATAHYFGVPSLLIGIVIVGFGTSAPEMLVSAMSAAHGNSGLALGNAYGSNITNIALILGLTAIISPVAVHSQVLRNELPLLGLATAVTIYLLWDLELTRIDAVILIVVFGLIMVWTVYKGLREKSDPLGDEVNKEIAKEPIGKALFQLVIGLAVLIASSRIFVWGAVRMAQLFGISDLIIGLTIVAVGTSLPELASSIAAARKNEHDIALGNILGSNLFNTLAVVGIAGVIKPLNVEAAVMSRDIPVMTILTLSLFIFGFNLKRQGRINRIEGTILLLCYVAYTAWLVTDVISH